MRYVVIFLILLLWACGDDVSTGNGSETTNGFISVVDTSNSPVPNTEVLIFAEDYNPVTDDSTDGYYTAITDEKGVAQFNINLSGRYNIYSSKGENQKVLERNVSFDNTDTLRKTVKLSRPGDLDVFIPSNFDTTSGYLYVEGTDLKREIDSTLIVAGDFRIVSMDNLPEGILPTIRYYSRDSAKEETIIDSIDIETDTLVDIAFTHNKNVKPVWAFSLKLSVHQDVVNDLGGYDKTIEQINTYYNYAMNRVNGNSVGKENFKGVLHFSVDTVTVFSHTMDDEGAIPLEERFDYRIIYGNTRDRSGSFLYRAETYYVYYPNSAALFDSTASPGVPQIFGQFRGALLLKHQNVRYYDNNIASVGYAGFNTIMNVEEANDWDSYNIAMVNHNEDRVGNEIDYSVQCLPDSIILEFLDTLGNPRKGIEIHLHEREWEYDETEPINPVAVINEKTDENGRIIIEKPLFTDQEKTKIINGNILIEIFDEDSTRYFTWLPVVDVGRSYIDGNKTSYVKKVSF